MKQAIGGLTLALMLGLAGLACTPVVRLQENLEDFDRVIERLERRILNEPGRAEPLRDLGVIYLRGQRYTEGNEYLQQAYARDPDDPKTLFYLGLASEMLGRRETALRLYGQDVSRSPYQRLMRGRLENLRRIQAKEEVARLLARERQQEAPLTSPRIVAVFPLSFLGGQDRYAPLGRGLSEMVMVDLAQVSSLTLVERVRIQALLEELRLGQSGDVDPATAPRSGRLLGAGRLVGGSFGVDAGRLALNVALVEADAADLRAIETTAGEVDRLFELEKQLVFSLLDEMEVEPTPAEREAIQRVPTRNLQAFLAFSRGLQEEDAGRFDAAAGAFGQAATLDPGFSVAAEHAEVAAGMHETVGSTGEVLAAAISLEPPPSRAIDLVGNRLLIMNNTLGGLVVPGEDTRKPAQEGNAPLGTPPLPPDR